jgi:hypothetical protein
MGSLVVKYPLPSPFLIAWPPVLGEDPAAGVVDLYVSPSLGNDSNPGTQAQPLATLARVDAVVPLAVSNVYNIHLRNETYPLPARNFWLRSRTYQPGGVINVFADETWDATVFTVNRSDTTAAGTTATTLVSATGGMVVNAFRGFSVRITSGALVGQYRRVNSNTATDLLLNDALTAVPAVGVSFQLITANTTITPPAATAPAFNYVVVDDSVSASSILSRVQGGLISGVVFRGLRFGAAGYFGTCDVFLDGITMPNGIGLTSARGRIWSGLGIDTKLRGWGLLAEGSAAFSVIGGSFTGAYTSLTQSIAISGGARASIAGGWEFRYLNFLADCFLQISGGVSVPHVIDASGGGSVALNLAAGVECQLVAANILGGGAGIIVPIGSTLRLATAVTGNGGGGAAMTVNGGGRVLCTGGAPSFGGAGADWTVQGAAAFNKAALAAVGSAVVGTDGSYATRAS